MNAAPLRFAPNHGLACICLLPVFVGLLWAVAGATPAAAQSGATLVGTVVDQSGDVLPGVDLALVNTDTSVERSGSSETGGAFTFTALSPGRYVLRASLARFSPLEVRDIVLNVNDRLTLRVELKVASLAEAVTVIAESQRVSTSPAVSTVIDRQFVENLPLNGRSLQSLLELTPGVVLTRVTNGQQDGQFSVNGQRSNANYVMVDGVSANTGITTGLATLLGQSGSGQTPALTTLGGTNGLVSVDALQEFRIQTSTYAPEFGRTPGGQVSMVTRSGTNVFHGSVFEFFRHDALDAGDWFSNSRSLPKPKLRQNNFGGVLGGPVFRNRAFFFASYEGLRLKQPRALIVAVPSAELRRAAIPELRPYLNASPLPNGADLGGGFAELAASFSDPSQFDSTSVRLDHNVAGKVTLFGRFNHAPSSSDQRAASLSSVRRTEKNNVSTTVGSTWMVSNRMVQDVRFNYTTFSAPFSSRIDTFGGAIPPPLSVFPAPRSPADAQFLLFLQGGGNWEWGLGNDNRQRQLNIVDSFTIATSSHEWKAGMDFRRIAPLLNEGGGGFDSLYFNNDDLLNGRAGDFQRFVQSTERRSVAFDNWSLYAQDNWRPTSRLTVTYGIRWEYVPPPHATAGPNAITLDNLNDPYGGNVRIAARNTPLWGKRYNNVAPRIGASQVLSEKPGAELIVRGGFGIFHDLSFGQVGSAFVTYPFSASSLAIAPEFPLTADALKLPSLIDDPPSQLWVVDRNIALPHTYQWNASIERRLGQHQTVTISYVGAAGRNLLKLDAYSISLLDWPGVKMPVFVNRNQGYSDYHALQMQFQRSLHKGLQTLASYTFGRSRDTSSNDIGTGIPTERLRPEDDYGFSDYDVRHVLTAAVSWQAAEVNSSSLRKILASNWGVDMMLRARSGFPINITAAVPFPPDFFRVRPNGVSGQSIWIKDASKPGGQVLNRAAFSLPEPNTQGNLPRGAVRGFNARQIDLALRRDFRVMQSLRLQARFELFNLFNTPNFLDPTGTLSSATFGRSTQMLNRGFGGLSPLYQIGGPRSAQVAVKLLF
jgi:hypothetical protein